MAIRSIFWAARLVDDGGAAPAALRLDGASALEAVCGRRGHRSPAGGGRHTATATVELQPAAGVGDHPHPAGDPQAGGAAASAYVVEVRRLPAVGLAMMSTAPAAIAASPLTLSGPATNAE